MTQQSSHARNEGPGGCVPWEEYERLQAAYFDEKQSRKDWANEAADYCQALEELAGDYGCTTIEPLDPAFPPTGDPCRDRRPDQPQTWCYACHATVALTGTQTARTTSDKNGG